LNAGTISKSQTRHGVNPIQGRNYKTIAGAKIADTRQQVKDPPLGGLTSAIL